MDDAQKNEKHAVGNADPSETPGYVFSYHDRVRQFRGPVMDAGENNPVIFQIIEMYAHGQIITKEEALSRMVVMLARDWSEEQKKLFDMCMSMPTKLFRT